MGSSHSDNYSFLDQNSDELSAKGDGGLRQMHAFATYNGNDSIETPPETINIKNRISKCFKFIK